MAKIRTLILSSADTFGNEIKKTFTGVNNAATVNEIDTALRALNGLTKNTYKDTFIVETESVNEAIEAQV